MDYPKHQALPESPLKKAKSFIAYSSSSPSSSSIDLSSMSTNMAAATDLLLLATSLTQATDDPFYNGIIQMIGTCNTMITMQSVSIKSLEEKYAKSIVMPIEKFDALIKHVKTLEDRLEELEGKTKANTNHILELGQTVGEVVDTSDILESRLDSLEGRISSIQRLIIRSCRRKRKRSNDFSVSGGGVATSKR